MEMVTVNRVSLWMIENQGGPLNVADTLGHMAAIAVVGAVDSAMEKLKMAKDLAGFMNVVVALDAMANLGEMDLVVETGVLLHGDNITQETEEPFVENEANVPAENQVNVEGNVDGNKKKPTNKEAEEKDPEENQMTLEVYEKVLKEKRKELLVLKVEERTVDVKEFESIRVISKKKDGDEVFAKLLFT